MEHRARNDPSDRNPRVDAASVPDHILGGADAVEKTTYLGDVHGAEVGDPRAQHAPLTASVRAPSGVPSLVWIALALAVLALGAYAVALFR